MNCPISHISTKKEITTSPPNFSEAEKGHIIELNGLEGEPIIDIVPEKEKLPV